MLAPGAIAPLSSTSMSVSPSPAASLGLPTPLSTATLVMRVGETVKPICCQKLKASAAVKSASVTMPIVLPAPVAPWP